MAWMTVIGQQRVKEILLHALRSGRMPHAYLFLGPEGVGKDAVALELARVLHCEQGGEEACGTCPACRRMAVLQHPDVRLVVPLPRGKDESNESGPLDKLTETEVRDVQEQLQQKAADPYHRIAIARATVIKVNSIREVRREASMTTSDRRRRVTIISQADLMNDESANMLLKTLEEPAGDTMLILTTAHNEQILPTIRSRCQVVRFDPLREEEIRDALMARHGLDEGRATMTARLANGSMTRAVDLLTEDLVQLRGLVVQFVRHALMSGITPLVADVDALVELKDRDVVRRFLQLMLLWFRDAMVLASKGTVINTDQQTDLASFVAKFGAADLPAILAGLERAHALVDRNVHPRLLLINVALLCRTILLDDVPGARPAALVGDSA